MTVAIVKTHKAKTYSSQDVMHIAGVTYRQIDYWCNHGVVPGSVTRPGSGRRRRFTQAQVLDFIFLGHLVKMLHEAGLAPSVLFLSHAVAQDRLRRMGKAWTAIGRIDLPGGTMEVTSLAEAACPECGHHLSNLTCACTACDCLEEDA